MEFKEKLEEHIKIVKKYQKEEFSYRWKARGRSN